MKILCAALKRSLPIDCTCRRKNEKCGVTAANTNSMIYRQTARAAEYAALQTVDKAGFLSFRKPALNFWEREKKQI